MLQNAAFKYFCKRPAVPGAIPKPENNSILSVTNYEAYRFVGAKKFLAEVVYAQLLSSDVAVAYELYADKLNADIQQEMHSLPTRTHRKLVLLWKICGHEKKRCCASQNGQNVLRCRQRGEPYAKEKV